MRKKAQDTTQIGPLPVGRRWSYGSCWKPEPLELITLLGFANYSILQAGKGRLDSESTDLGYFGTSIRLHFRSRGAVGSYQPILTFHCLDGVLELVTYVPPLLGSWVIPYLQQGAALDRFPDPMQSLAYEISTLASAYHGGLVGTVVRHEPFVAGPVKGVPNLVNVEVAYWI